jgi:tRNA A37 threonylcarbamoyladenosine modification protein TsaB
MMDARRSQVYTGIFRFTDHALVTVREQWPCDAAELCSILDSYGEPVTVLGDGVPVCREILKECLHVSWSEAPAHLNRQRAAAVAITAARYYEEGRTVSAEAHVPEYLRLSQAERERAERQKMAAAKKEEQA